MLPFWGLLIIFLALNILDYVTTHEALTVFRRFEGERATAHEKNPIARFVLNRGGGLAGLAWLKLWGMTVLVAIFSHLGDGLAFTTVPLCVINLLMLLVVLNNTMTIRRAYRRYEF